MTATKEFYHSPLECLDTIHRHPRLPNSGISRQWLCICFSSILSPQILHHPGGKKTAKLIQVGRQTLWGVSQSINLLSTNRVSKLLVASCCIISFCPVHLGAFYCGLVVYQLSYMFTLHIFIDLNTSLADSMQSTMICDLCSSQICFRACGQLSESGSGTYHKELQPSINTYQWPWQIDFAIFCYHPLSCIFVHHRRSFASFCKTKSFCEHHYRAAFGLWDTNTEWGSCLALGPRTCRSPSVQWLWCCKGGCLKWLRAPRIRSNQSLSRPNSSRRKAANGSPYSAWSCSPYVFNAEDTLWVAHPFCSCMLLCATAVDVCMRGRRRG